MKIAIIPARGGSKRIPRKNIKLFNGIPIIGRVIQTVRAANMFDRVIVSTEDSEIGNIAKQYGAEVPFYRRIEAADDHATLYDVVADVLSQLDEDISLVCVVLPTAVLVNEKTIQDVVNQLEDGAIDSALTVVEYESSFEKALTVDSEGLIKKLDPTSILKRSQEQTRFYHDAGQVYALKVSEFKSRASLTSSSCRAVFVSRIASQDIDTLEDWMLAEAKFETLMRWK